MSEENSGGPYDYGNVMSVRNDGTHTDRLLLRFDRREHVSPHQRFHSIDNILKAEGISPEDKLLLIREQTDLYFIRQI